MDDTLLRLLADTESAAEGPRKQAESNPVFPTTLGDIASHSSVSTQIRQSALLVLRTFVDRNWSGENEEGNVVFIGDDTKERLRGQMLELAISGDADRKIKTLAR